MCMLYRTKWAPKYVDSLITYMGLPNQVDGLSTKDLHGNGTAVCHESGTVLEQKWSDLSIDCNYTPIKIGADLTWHLHSLLRKC